MRVKYVLNEVLVGLWRNVTMTIAMIITLSVSLTMLGASVLMYMQVDQMKDFYYGKIEVSIFLTEDVTDGAAHRHRRGPRRPTRWCATRCTRAKEQAFGQVQGAVPGLARPRQRGAARTSCPSRSGSSSRTPRQYDEFAGRSTVSRASRTSSTSASCWRRCSTSSTSIQLLALVIASVMAIAALLLVGNTIQVAAYSKRREVAVMKLVGASNWFIQAPFVLEAMVAGLARLAARLRRALRRQGRAARRPAAGADATC